MEIFKQKIFLILIAVSGALLLAALGLLIFGVSGSSAPLIIHFDPAKGVDVFGNLWDVWAVWLTGAVLVITNTVLSRQFYYRERFLTYIFLGANTLISLFTLVIIATIASMN